MPKLILENLCKDYQQVHAVRQLDLEIPDGEFMVLVGPSGCGKTTTLRMIAGLESITGGNIYLDDVRINDMPSKDRDMAMVFQDYALYPHMTVYDNIAFGLKMRKTPKDEIRRRVEKTAELSGITGLLKRKPHALSGGERQRVALGRAIVRQPKVFLLDEPLSNLDAALRVQMREELLQLHKRLQTTFIYVTHDQIEAMTMATRIAVLDRGVMQQCDTPGNLYAQPINRFVAEFIGNPKMNMLPCLLALENEKVMCYIGNDKIGVPGDLSARLLKQRAVGRPLLLGMRPEHIHICAADAPDSLPVQLHHSENTGSDAYLYLQSENIPDRVILRLTPDRRFEDGQVLGIRPDWKSARFFDGESGEALSAINDIA